MSFVASTTVVNAGAANTTLPSYGDASGFGGKRSLYPHARVDAAGAVNIGFDGGATRVSLPAAGGSVIFAVPTAAQVINTSGACTLSFGADV